MKYPSGGTKGTRRPPGSAGVDPSELLPEVCVLLLVRCQFVTRPLQFVKRLRQAVAQVFRFVARLGRCAINLIHLGTLGQQPHELWRNRARQRAPPGAPLARAAEGGVELGKRSPSSQNFPNFHLVGLRIINGLNAKKLGKR